MTDDPTQAALDLADRYWEELLPLEPFLGTEIGDDRFDDQMPDPSEHGRARLQDLQKRALEELAGIDRTALDAEVGPTMDILEAMARRQLDDLTYRTDRMSAVSQFGGPANLIADLASLQRADTPERLEKYAARLSRFPAYLDALGEVAMEAVSAGQTSPGLVLDRTIGQVERLLALTPETSPAMEPVSGGSDADRARVVALLRDAVWPAYARYLQVLRDYRPTARESIGLSALPDGEAMYAAQVRAFVTLPLDPREVHQTGLDALARIQEERRDIAGRLGYADAAAAIAAHTESGRNTAPSREELVRLVEEQVQRSWDEAPRFFGRLPQANCRVKQVEEFREQDVPIAFYQPATGDGSRPGTYYINTGDLPQRPLHLLAGVTFHEANPGHHFQITIEQEFGERPPLRRFGGIMAGSAFAEGWGLYSERLADEMGLYRDEYERLGMLDAQGWRANRLIVDTGIHALGWDRDRAVHQMIQAGPPRAAAEIEVDRYIAWPGQALAYKIGQIEIERVRSEAAAREGDRFSLSDFHDRVLSLGSVPLTTLRREFGAAAGGSAA